MKKEELVKLGITEELADKVIAAIGDVIPKARFDEVNERMKTAEKNVAERDTQIETLKKSTKDNAELQTQIADLQKQNKDAADKYAADIKQRSRDNSINLAFTGKKARNIAAARSLVTFEDADFDGNNELGKAGLAKIEKAFTENAWAFEAEAKTGEPAPAPKLQGITPIPQDSSKDGSGKGIGATAAASFLSNFAPAQASK